MFLFTNSGPESVEFHTDLMSNLFVKTESVLIVIVGALVLK